MARGERRGGGAARSESEEREVRLLLIDPEGAKGDGAMGGGAGLGKAMGATGVIDGAGRGVGGDDSGGRLTTAGSRDRIGLSFDASLIARFPIYAHCQ